MVVAERVEGEGDVSCDDGGDEEGLCGRRDGGVGAGVAQVAEIDGDLAGVGSAWAGRLDPDGGLPGLEVVGPDGYVDAAVEVEALRGALGPGPASGGGQREVGVFGGRREGDPVEIRARDGAGLGLVQMVACERGGGGGTGCGDERQQGCRGLRSVSALPMRRHPWRLAPSGDATDGGWG